LVFFSLAAVHRVLHSFPTRRSSDLGFLATGGETYLRDHDGKIIWQYPHSSRDGWVLPNGHVLLALSKSAKYPHGAVVEVTRKNRSEEHTSELQSQSNLVCRLLLEKK